MKIKILFLIFCINLNATILFIGDDSLKYSCDGKENSPIAMENCKEIKAITDISFCYFLDSNMDCKKLRKGKSLSLSNIKSKPIEFSRLLSFTSEKQITFGIKRFADVKELKDSILPTGDILKPKSFLTLFISGTEKKEIWIDNGKKKLVNITTNKDMIKIPYKDFKYNKKYNLNIKINGKIYTSKFYTLDLNTQKEVFNEYKALSRKISDKKARKYIKSILYDQYGLVYNRIILLREI